MTLHRLGGFVKIGVVARGIHSEVRFLSLIVGRVGLVVAALVAGSGIARPA
jgi:hypothetical protein